MLMYTPYCGVTKASRAGRRVEGVMEMVALADVARAVSNAAPAFFIKDRLENTRHLGERMISLVIFYSNADQFKTCVEK